MMLVIDNYDSFVYNLAQYVAEAVGSESVIQTGITSPALDRDQVLVVRNDAVSTEDIVRMNPNGIVVSPGPGTPQQSGVSLKVFTDLTIPILGVCLGHQALCAANNIEVTNAPEVVHGKPSIISHDKRELFKEIPNPIKVGRYHSLGVKQTALRAPLVETAHTVSESGIVMAVKHRYYPHYGVQFHPESILTGRPTDSPDDAKDLSIGKKIIHNFIDLCSTT
jgi:anthranilate synthase component 2